LAGGAIYSSFEDLMENAMTNETLTVRMVQALFAVGVTTASILVFQFAMLTG
jgi:hypothetical protein